MDDPFLQVTGVDAEQSAMSNALQSALQHNKTYSGGLDSQKRAEFRAEWAQFIAKSPGVTLSRYLTVSTVRLFRRFRTSCEGDLGST